MLTQIAYGRQNKTTVEVNGFIMTDAGYNFNTIDPDWFDVMRPTKLPAHKGAFAPAGNVYFSVRQTRFGVKSSTLTPKGELHTQIDIDMFGFGKNAGQTTIHLINAFAQMGKMLVGQTASILMDQDAVPVTLDYWGPMARVFNFNVQLRYMPLWNEKRRLAFAIERPGATADGGDSEASIQLNEVKPVFRMPNVLAQYRTGGKWGHVQLAAMFKLLKWQDESGATHDLSGSTIGWGWALSTVINATERIKLKMQVVQGEGIESHIADAPADVVPDTDTDNATRPIKGIAQPVWGFYSFAEIAWNRSWASTIGYSQESVKNGDRQAANAFKNGQYGLLNMRYVPTSRLMIGIEYQYGRRKNFEEQYTALGNKLQLSFKYYFSSKPWPSNQQ
jgi:hypothetical protein